MVYGKLSRKVKRMRNTAMLLGLGFTGGCFADSAQFLGAEAVLAQIEAREKQGNTAETRTGMTSAELSAEIVRLSDQFPTMDADEAGRQWMKLVAGWWSMDNRSDSDGGMDHTLLQKIFANLPRPEAWPALHEAAEQTTSSDPINAAIVQVVAAKLNGKPDETSAALVRLRTVAGDPEIGGMFDGISKQEFKELEEKLLGQADSPPSVIDRFTKLIELRQKGSEYESDFDVPDLVALSNEATARELLTKALKLKKTKLRFTGKNKTLVLARQMALENIDNLDSPRWDLVQSLGSVTLFDALAKKYPDEIAEPSGDSDSDDRRRNSDRLKANVYHYLDLIAVGNLEVADEYFSGSEEFLSELKSAIDETLIDLPADTLYKDLLGRLKKPQQAPYKLWEMVKNLARPQGRLKEFIPQMAAAADKLKPDDKTQPDFLMSLARTYLEINDPDKAMQYLDQVCDLSNNIEGVMSEKIDAAGKMIQVGEVLYRTEWSEKGIERLKSFQKDLISNRLSIDSRKPYEHSEVFYRIDQVNDKLVSALLNRGRGVEAEACITELLAWMTVQEKNNISDQKKELLQQLVLAYGQSGRNDDIMTLLTNAPWWGADDLRSLSSSINGLDSVVAGQFEVMVARALDASGYRDVGRELLKRTLINNPSADLAYDELTSMTGASIIPWLDDLATRDLFEERPLIWKAVVLMREGDLEKAEEAARAAIKIDPTDGEQPKGARLKAYAVLAEILTAKNETSEAETLQEVVASVRLAERGDELNSIGLVEQAVKTYEQASRNFSDAYCVEWRLARRLQEMGDEDGATAHYEKAFQLMPNQFGRMANLCFGCENIFETKKPQSIAERVLLSMTNNPVVQPTVYDLLGQLREAQDNYVEAAQYYRKATKTDPDYYDGWKHLHSVGSNVFMSSYERSQVVQQLIRLDPYLKHFSIQSDIDLPPEVLWKAGERNRKWMTDLRKPLFELSASKPRYEEQIKTSTSNFEKYGKVYRIMRNTWAGPAEHIVQQGWLTNLMQHLRRSRYMGM